MTKCNGKRETSILNSKQQINFWWPTLLLLNQIIEHIGKLPPPQNKTKQQKFCSCFAHPAVVLLLLLLFYSLSELESGEKWFLLMYSIYLSIYLSIIYLSSKLFNV